MINGHRPRKGRETGPFRFPVLVAVVVVVALVAVLSWQWRQPVVHALDGYTMGSGWSVRFVGPADADAAAVRVVLERELNAMEAELSGYRADSSLSRLNRAPVGEWVAIPPSLAAVLRAGQTLWRESGGAFDMTVKPLVALWGFGAAEPRSTLPGEAEIAAARARMGSDRLEISVAGDRARRLADVEFDVDGIAPGYAGGVLSRLLAERGFPDHLVEVGGEMRASGRRPDGHGWRVGIEAPEMARGRVEKIIEVSDTALTTAGDYRDYFEVDGRRYPHILDPATGWPVTHQLASVTVLLPDQLSADGYATAIMVMGPEKGLAWADRLGLPVYLLLRDGKRVVERYNDRFASYIGQ